MIERKAWECPRCRAINAPHVDTCPKCTPEVAFEPPTAYPWPITPLAPAVSPIWITPNTTGYPANPAGMPIITCQQAPHA